MHSTCRQSPSSPMLHQGLYSVQDLLVPQENTIPNLWNIAINRENLDDVQKLLSVHQTQQIELRNKNIKDLKLSNKSWMLVSPDESLIYNRYTSAQNCWNKSEPDLASNLESLEEFDKPLDLFNKREKLVVYTIVTNLSCAIFLRGKISFDSSTFELASVHNVKNTPDSFKKVLQHFCSRAKGNIEIFLFGGKRFKPHYLEQINAIIDAFTQKLPANQMMICDDLSKFLENGNHLKNLQVTVGLDSRANPFVVMDIKQSP